MVGKVQASATSIGQPASDGDAQAASAAAISSLESRAGSFIVPTPNHRPLSFAGHSLRYPCIERQTSPLTGPAKRLRAVQQPAREDVEIANHGLETDQ